MSCSPHPDSITESIEQIALTPDDLIVSVHACGRLTDLVPDRAVGAGAKVAVLPCCHDLDTADTGGLRGWMDGPLAVDATRAARLRAGGGAGFTLKRSPRRLPPRTASFSPNRNKRLS